MIKLPNFALTPKEKACTVPAQRLDREDLG